jgi:hypothetical protein
MGEALRRELPGLGIGQHLVGLETVRPGIRDVADLFEVAAQQLVQIATRLAQPPLLDLQEERWLRGRLQRLVTADPEPLLPPRQNSLESLLMFLLVVAVLPHRRSSSVLLP